MEAILSATVWDVLPPVKARVHSSFAGVRVTTNLNAPDVGFLLRDQEITVQQIVKGDGPVDWAVVNLSAGGAELTHVAGTGVAIGYVSCALLEFLKDGE